MARREKVDRVLANRLEELEQLMFRLKIQYEKYFSGLERIEPVREREDARRLVRELAHVPITSSVQRFKMRTLRARWNTLDLYFTRNLVQIERGTHPKFKFRADLKDGRRKGQSSGLDEARARLAERRAQSEREETAYRAVFDRYVEARQACGQSSDMEFESVRKALHTQVRTIKSRYKCDSVKFRVTVEDGKARLKAVPQR